MRHDKSTSTCSRLVIERREAESISSFVRVHSGIFFYFNWSTTLATQLTSSPPPSLIIISIHWRPEQKRNRIPMTDETLHNPKTNSFFFFFFLLFLYKVDCTPTALCILHTLKCLSLYSTLSSLANNERNDDETFAAPFVQRVSFCSIRFSFSSPFSWHRTNSTPRV